MNLLKVAVEEHELKSQRLHAKERFVNPKKDFRGRICYFRLDIVH